MKMSELALSSSLPLNGNSGERTEMIKPRSESLPVPSSSSLQAQRQRRLSQDDEDGKTSESIDWQALRGKLYAREKETRLLLERFESIAFGDTDQNELVLITGPSGNGKTALAKQLLEEVKKRNGYFISGKFDQLQKPESFGAFGQAFTEYVQQLVKQEEPERIARLQSDVLEAVGTEGHTLLTQMIPSLSILLGQVPGDDKAADLGFEAQQRFQLIFERFVEAICSVERPLVLFLDDLQWANKESVDLLASLVTMNNVEGLMILGACRGNEVSAEHELSIMLRRLEDSYQLEITDIQVDCLDKETIEQMLQDLFNLPTPKSSESVAHLVHDKTGGNPFHAIQLVRYLSEDGLLRVTDSGKFTINHSALHSLYIESGEDIIGLLRSKIEQLPKDLQTLLQVSSCLGSEFDVSTLDRIVDQSKNESGLSNTQLLGIADDEGFVACIRPPTNQYSSQYTFVHDRVQQAVYSMISDKPAFHVNVGRKLWKSYKTTEELVGNSPLVINQLSHGIELIEKEKDRTNAAQLSLHAGKLAMEASSFRTASAYFSTGIKLLGTQPWIDPSKYELALALYTTSAELQYVIGNPHATDELVDEILENARTFDDKLQAYTTLIYSLGARCKFVEAIELSSFVLNELKEPLPKNVVFGFIRTSSMLRNKSNDDILNLPKMTDKYKLRCMKILNVVFTFVMVSQPLLAPLYAFKMVQLTLKHGLNPMSGFGFVAYSIPLLALGKVDEGVKLADLAIELLREFGGRQEWVARTYFMAHAFCYTTKYPVRESIGPLLYAYRIGLGVGDCEFALHSCQFSSFIAIFAGQPLQTLYPEMKLYRQKIVEFKQTRVLRYHDCAVQYVANLVGESENPSVLTGQYMNTEAALNHARESEHEGLLYMIMAFNLGISYLNYDLERAEHWYNSLEKVDERPNMVMAVRLVNLFRGLVCFALAEQETKYLRRRKHLRGAKKALKALRRGMEVSPQNVAFIVRFLEAEYERVAKRNLHASLQKYEIASELAGNESALLQQGLAYERAASMLTKEGKAEEAVPFFEKARDVYKTFGATVKEDHMRKFLAEGDQKQN